MAYERRKRASIVCHCRIMTSHFHTSGRKNRLFYQQTLSHILPEIIFFVKSTTYRHDSPKFSSGFNEPDYFLNENGQIDPLN